jgi:hypothetical protein
MPAKGGRSGRGKYKSIKNVRRYRALKRKGYSKARAAQITNGLARKGK